MAALLASIMRYKRRSFASATLSNKFALSDIQSIDSPAWSVVLVSWVDSPEISPLAFKVST